MYIKPPSIDEYEIEVYIRKSKDNVKALLLLAVVILTIASLFIF